MEQIGRSLAIISFGYHTEMSKDQQSLLNPAARDVQLGSLVNQAFGNCAKKKEAKTRIAVIDGNINSYSRLLNGKSQMEMIKDYDSLSVSIGQFNAEKCNCSQQ